jgi:hypothetical protein
MPFSGKSYFGVGKIIERGLALKLQRSPYDNYRNPREIEKLRIDPSICSQKPQISRIEGLLHECGCVLCGLCRCSRGVKFRQVFCSLWSQPKVKGAEIVGESPVTQFED